MTKYKNTRATETNANPVSEKTKSLNSSFLMASE